MIIPITEGKRRSVYPPTSEKPPAVATTKLTHFRVREITPIYRDVDIECAVSERLRRTGRIHCCEDVAALFRSLAFESKEHFYAIHLDTKHRILCLDQVSIGSLSSSIVHPREVFKSILVSSAAAVIFVHNHPSGDPTPSTEDKVIQQRLVEAGELLGIQVLDHIIIGRDGAFESLTYPGISNMESVAS